MTRQYSVTPCSRIGTAMRSPARWLTVGVLAIALAACNGGSTETASNNTPPPPGPAAPTVSLSANPASVTSGGSSTLTWSSTNATSCTASGAWSGSKATSGSQSTGALTGNATYTLSCTGSGGTNQASVTVTVTGPVATLTFTASPTIVVSGGSSTLTWSSANVSSCTASGAWTGSKATSGNESTGALTSSSTYTLNCTGTNGSVQRSVTVSVSANPPPPGGALNIPTLEDERNTYRSWNWSWTADTEPGAVTEPIVNYYITDPDIHGDTEGDDLWTYLVMYRRTAHNVYLNRALAWARYFKDEYRTDCSSYWSSFCGDNEQYGSDHMYGWGLIGWYQHTCEQGSCDNAALTEAENLGIEVEKLWAPGSAQGCLREDGCTEYGLRKVGRHLLLITRLAEVTGSPRWITLRDQIINTVINSPYWDAGRGMYFAGEWTTDQALGAGAYAAGMRIQSPFPVGVLAEAFYQSYRTTERRDLRDRIVAMAEFVYQNGLDPTYRYTGIHFGVKDGKPWHEENPTQSTVLNCSIFWDPVYTTSLVNTLVMGYKFTGERRYYDRAKEFFNRGTKGIFGEACQRAAADDVVHHFVDTIFSSASGYYYFKFNKGELQYTYLVFENGGDPFLVP